MNEGERERERERGGERKLNNKYLKKQSLTINEQIRERCKGKK